MLLTSMYLAIGNSLQALPSQLGQLTMWRALVQVQRLSGRSGCCFTVRHAAACAALCDFASVFLTHVSTSVILCQAHAPNLQSAVT